MVFDKFKCLVGQGKRQPILRESTQDQSVVNKTGIVKRRSPGDLA
ncbi:MAG: hypothetical protein ACK58N_02110 [Synechocystis sp.]